MVKVKLVNTLCCVLVRSWRSDVTSMLLCEDMPHRQGRSVVYTRYWKELLYARGSCF